MKKITLILVLLGVTLSALPQDQRHDFAVSYGIITTEQIVDVLEDVLLTLFTLGNFDRENATYTGARFVTYKYGVSERFYAGISGGQDKSKASLYWDGQYEGILDESHFTLAAECDFRWIKKDMIQMYSGLGFGRTFSKNTATLIAGENETIRTGHFAFQLNLLGFRLGRNFSLFTELGFGYKGILNFGMSYQL